MRYLRAKQQQGLTLIEILVALGILLFVLFLVYQTFIAGSAARASAQARLAALRFAEMEQEEIAGTPYDELPPEKHRVHIESMEDGTKICRIKLSHIPIKESVRVWSGDGEPLTEEFQTDYTRGQVILPLELNGKEVIVSYAYEYPRRELIVIPQDEPYRVRLSAEPLLEVAEVTDAAGGAVPVSVDYDGGWLEFQAQDAGKTVTVKYRGKDDRGTVEGTCLSDDLGTESRTDTGIKLLKVSETWVYNGKERKLELAYVRTR